MDAKLTPTEVDIIFSSIKSKGERRINFREFCEGLQRMATAKVRKGGTPPLGPHPALLAFSSSHPHTHTATHPPTTTTNLPSPALACCPRPPSS